MNKLVWQIIITSFCISISFNLYVVLCNYNTTYYEIHGFYINIILLLSATFGSMLSGFISYYIRSKSTILIGIFTLIIWMVCYTIVDNIIIIYLITILCGLGSGLIMSLFNIWICSLDIYGNENYYIGIGNSMLSIGSLISGLIAILILYFDVSFNIFVIIITCISCCCFTIILFYSTNIKNNETHNISFSIIYDILKHMDIWMFIPIFVLYGANIIFASAILPLYFKGNGYMISLNFMILSLCMTLCSWLIGNLYKRMNVYVLLLIQCLIIIFMTIAIELLIYFSMKIEYYFILSILGGFSYSISLSIYSIELSIWFREFKCVYCLSRSIIYLSGACFGLIALYTPIEFYLFLMMMSACTFLFFYKYLKYWNKKRDNQELEPIIK
jgi:hypothetical protein